MFEPTDDEREATRGIKLGIAVLLLSIGWSVLSASGQKQPATTGPSEFTIGGAVTTLLTISVADLKKMQQTTLNVTDAHSHPGGRRARRSTNGRGPGAVEISRAAR